MYKHEDKNQKGWTSSDMRIYSTLLTQILVKLCGKLSHNKYISSRIVFSNRECILGFLDAYISGDGCVSSKKHKDGTINPMDVMICSASKNVMMDVMVMLRNLDIDSEVHSMTRQTKNNRGTLPENIHQMYRFVTINPKN